MYKLVGYEDHEVQRASGYAANESQENSTEENEKENVAATKIAGDNVPEDKTSTDPETGSSNRTAELRALLSDTVSSTIEGNRQLTAKNGGKRNIIKSKEMGVVEGHDTREKENLISSEEKSKQLLYCLYQCNIKNYTHRFFFGLMAISKRVSQNLSVEQSRF